MAEIEKGASEAIQNVPQDGGDHHRRLEHRPWVELYLADVPTSIAGKHYDIKSGKIISELDKAIVYLGQQMGLPRGRGARKAAAGASASGR